MRLKTSFHIDAMITILFWSLAYVLTRLALQYFTAFCLGFLRYFIASCTLLAVAFIAKMKLPQKQDLSFFILSGTLGFFLYMIAFNQGQATVTAATGSILISIVPVLTAFLSQIVYREKLGYFQWFAIFIEFVGVAVLTLTNGVLSINKGLFWLFLAALSLSLYNLLQRRLTKKYTALQTSAYSIFFGTILLAIFAPASIKEASHAPVIQWVYLAVLGVCSSAIAYAFWSRAFAKASQTSEVSNYMFVTPFLTSLLGFLIAGEVPERSSLIGGAIILTGVFLFTFGEKLYEVIQGQKGAA